MTISASPFKQRLGQDGQWRERLLQKLRTFERWLADRGLLDMPSRQRLQQLQEKAISEKITVAFVAEPGRGKSALIHALFFGQYGQNVMPSVPGKLAQCPMELTWNPLRAVGIYLLPIATRQQTDTLADWRQRENAWVHLPLDLHSADSVATAIACVTETVRVSGEQAQLWGLCSQGEVDDMPAGMVDVPKWRHAVVNFPHPLLKKGLVILDIPGLHAIGAEPEQTLELLPQAQAVVFMLGMDTGLAASDLSLWNHALLTHLDSIGLRLVVLNKADLMWEDAQHQGMEHMAVRQHCENVAQALQIPVAHVMPVAAQKARMARAGRDASLWQASGLGRLEAILVDGLLDKRQQLFSSLLHRHVLQVQQHVVQQLQVRIRHNTQQAIEMADLQGQNKQAMYSVRIRMARERQVFETSVAQVRAARAQQQKLLNQLFQQLGTSAVKKHLHALAEAVQQPVPPHARDWDWLYAQAFQHLQQVLQASQQQAEAMRTALAQVLERLNQSGHFLLDEPAPPDLREFCNDLQKIADSHRAAFAHGTIAALQWRESGTRLLATLGMRVRLVFEAAANELELWSKTHMASLDVQLRARRQTFVARGKTLTRIQQADVGLEKRLVQIRQRFDALKQDERLLHTMVHAVLQAPPPQMAADAVPQGHIVAEATASAAEPSQQPLTP